MRLSLLEILMLVALASVSAIVCLYLVWGGSASAGNLNTVDPYSPIGWFEVTCEDDTCIRYNPRTGESWALHCPTMRTCRWEPVEERHE